MANTCHLICVIQDESIIMGEKTTVTQKCRYKIFYDSSAGERTMMMFINRAIKHVIKQSPGVVYLLPRGGNWSINEEGFVLCTQRPDRTGNNSHVAS